MKIARVLVIEDNPVNLELMTYMLRAWQHEPITATDGDTGLERALALLPDLIVCDVQMPGRDGLAVARALKSEPATRSIPLVAVTAFAMSSDRDAALAAGFDRYVSKPIDPQQFMETVHSLLRQPGRAPAQAGRSGGDAPARPIPDSLRAPRSPTRLLIADDGAANVAFKQSLFEPAGYTVRVAGDVDEAFVQARAEPVDLVLSDVEMPGGGGFELLRRIRGDAGLAGLPFVFLTSSARDAESHRNGLALGADRYLLRPIDPIELLQAIREVLDSPSGPSTAAGDLV